MRQPGDVSMAWSNYVFWYQYTALAATALEAAGDVIEDGGIADTTGVEQTLGDVVGFLALLDVWCPELDLVRASTLELHGSVRLGVSGRGLLPTLSDGWRRLQALAARVHTANAEHLARLTHECDVAQAEFSVE